MELGKIRYWLSMTDPKYLPMMILPLVVVYLAGGPADGWIIFGGVVAIAVLNTAAVLVNMSADRKTDTFNFPAGARAIERYIGYDRLWIPITIFSLLMVAATVSMWFGVNHQTAVIYALGCLIAINYSSFLRLKRYLLFSRIAICCGPSFSFAGGWVLRHSLLTVPPQVAILFLAQGIHLLLKDVPDAEGDRRAGVKTLFTGFSRDAVRRLLPLLWALPYLLASAGAWLGLWPSRYHWLWVLYPVGLKVIQSALSGSTAREHELSREFAQFHASLFVFLNLILFSPTPTTLIICAAAIAYYLAILALRLDRRQQSHGMSSLLQFIASGVPRRSR
jgi:4-hydroxybenzoate polyprenyltransferase